jgi:hypothetical protein
MEADAFLVNADAAVFRNSVFLNAKNIPMKRWLK